VLSALLALLFTGETLSTGQILGIALTLAGVAWVISDKKNNSSQREKQQRFYTKGILYGVGAAACQALGLVTAKFGLTGGFSALSGTLIRMVSAAALIWLLTLFSRQVNITLTTLANQSKLIWLILAGSFAGPFLGVTLSLVAVQNTALGVASTLSSLSPLFLLPIGYFFFSERFGWRAISGTILAMMGVALLFLL
jgi:drug/metabolite transporter (DMT)-like permease